MTAFNNLLFQKNIKAIGIALLSMLTTTISFSQTYNWNNVAIGGGGFVSGIITSKTEQGMMFCRTDVGGAYRWDSTNSKWIPLLDWTSENETGWQGVESIAMDPQASQNVYMLVGTDYFNSGKTAILRSTDYGNTFAITDVTSQFKAHGNGMGRQNGEKLVVDPNKGSVLFCGSRRNGLFKSTNSGASWSNITTTGSGTANDNGISFVLIDSKSATTGNASQTIFFGVSQTSNNFYKSTNGGTSFSLVTGGPALMPQRAVLASDNNMYITYADKEGPWNIGSGAIWKYNITTGAWTNVSPVLPGATPGFGGISVDPNNPNRLIASTTNLYWTQFPNAYGDRMFLSTNGGTSWTDLVGNGITVNPNGCTWITGKSIHWAGCIEFNPFNTAQAYVISGNGVFVCDNVNAASTTWKFLPKGLEETVALDIVSITGGPVVSVIGDYDGFVHSDITQYAPIHVPNIGTTTGLAVAALSTSKMVRVGGDATGGGKMYYTTNQGTSWTQTANINGFKGKVALSANGNTILHCPEGSSTMYRSTNNGGAWSTCNGLSIADAVPVADMVNANKFYAYNSTSGILMVSTDGGANFSNSGSPGAGGSKIIRTVPGVEGDIWVPLYNGGLTHSTNSGATFTKLTNVTRCDAVGLGKAAPSATYHTLYIWGTVGGVTGVFRSIDQGANWVRVNDDAHEYGGPGNGQFVIGDMNVYGRVYMSTVGRGIAYGETTTATCTATITSSSTSICPAGSVLLTSSTGASYKWSNAAGVISGATNATYSASAAGSYTVEVTNASGCKATSTATVITGTIQATPTITSPSTSICPTGSVLLTSSTGDSYKWSNAAGVISGATNATYSASAAGSYTVEVTNASGCKATSTATVITGTTQSTPTITSQSTSICPTGAVLLTSSTGASYKWSNSAGVISGATNATYSAGAAGFYTVEVTNASGCKATSTAILITGTIQATPTITSQSTSICPAGSVLLTSSTGASYKWSNAAGIISGATNATYSTSAAGSYTVEVTNASGCKATSTATVITGTIQATPTITSPSTTICPTGSVLLTSSTGDSYKWSNAAGVISVATNATYSTSAAGSYTVEVTNASGCKATSTVTVITGNTQVTPTITSSSTSICPTGSVLLTSSTGDLYKWSNAAGVISGATNATYSASVAESYTVEVTNASGCKSTSAASVITGTIQATPTITSPSTSICPTGSVLLTSSTGASYKWSNAAGVISGATNATYSASAAGSYTVEVINASGCKSTSAATVITGTTQVTPTITSPSTSFCTGSSVILSTSTGTNLTYQWSNTAGTISGATNASYAAITAGTYTVKVTNSSMCSATSAPITITQTASITWYLDTDGDGKGTPNTTINSCTQPIGYVSTAGDGCPNDAAKIAAGNCGCGNSETSCIDCAGVPNGAAFTDNCSVCVGGTTGNAACVTTATRNGTNINISVSPQPFQTATTIKLENLGTIESITVLNSAGALVEQKQNIHATEIILGESFASGMYSVIIYTANEVFITKIIKF